MLKALSGYYAWKEAQAALAAPWPEFTTSAEHEPPSVMVYTAR